MNENVPAESLQTYEEYREELKSEQSQKTYEEVRDEMRRESKHIVELDNLPTQKHIWIDRGAVKSCENAGHPYHQVYVKQR